MEVFFWQVFITLLVVIDPFAVVPIFINLTQHYAESTRRKIALKACLISLFLLLLFAFLGEQLLSTLKISESAFRIAGGVLLFLAAVEMVMGKSMDLAEESKEIKSYGDIAVFPLAIPLMAGPGALTSMVVLMRRAETMNFSTFWVIILTFVVLLMTYICLRMSDVIIKIIGLTGTNILTRVFGIILAALAAQNILSGLSIAFNIPNT